MKHFCLLQAVMQNWAFLHSRLKAVAYQEYLSDATEEHSCIFKIRNVIYVTDKL